MNYISLSREGKFEGIGPLIAKDGDRKSLIGFLGGDSEIATITSPM